MRVYKALLAQFQGSGIGLGFSASPGICLAYLLSVGLQGPAECVSAASLPSIFPSIRSHSLQQTLLRDSKRPRSYGGLRRKGFGWQPLTLGHTGCPAGEKTGLQSCASPVGGRGSPSVVRWLQRGGRSAGYGWADYGSGGSDNPGGRGDHGRGRCACGSGQLPRCLAA